jgi:hypothetical protein
MANRWLKNCPTASPQVQAIVAYWFGRTCLRWSEVAVSGAWPAADAGAGDGLVVTTAPQEFVTVGAPFVLGDVGKLLAVYDVNNALNCGVFPIVGFTATNSVTLGGAADWQVDATDLEWVMFDPAAAPALDEWAVLAPANADSSFQVFLSPRSAPHQGLAFQINPEGQWTTGVTGPIPGGVDDGEMELIGTADWIPFGGVNVSKSILQAQTGAQSLQINSFGLGDLESNPFNGLTDGNNYICNFWVYNNAGIPHNARIWNGAAFIPAAALAPNGVWTQYSVPFTKQVGTDAYFEFSASGFIPINVFFLDNVEVVDTQLAAFSTPSTNFVNLEPTSTTLFAVGDDDHILFWDEGGASRAGVYVGDFEPLHPPPYLGAEGDTDPSCVLGVDSATPEFDRDTTNVNGFAQGGSALFSNGTTVITCYLCEWETADATATDVFGDPNFQTNPRTTLGVAWQTMIIHRETPALGTRSKAIRGRPKNLYLVNANHLNRDLLESDSVYVVQNGLAVTWDGSTPL